MRKYSLLCWVASVGLACCLLSCSPSISSRYDLLQEAEELVRQGRTAEAIQRYQEHIEWRLSVRDRPDWENPYFYLLLIGDLHAESGNMQEALVCYQDAQKLGIESALVSDRYRYLAHKLELRGELERAMEILKEHRDLDPLLFDAMLDRISRTLTLQEQIDDPKKTNSHSTR